MHTSLLDSQHQHNFFQIRISPKQLISSFKNSALSIPHIYCQIDSLIFNERENFAYDNDDYYDYSLLMLLLHYLYYSELLKFSIDYLLAQSRFPPHPERSNHCFLKSHQRFTLFLHLFIILRYCYFAYFSSFPSS